MIPPVVIMRGRLADGREVDVVAPSARVPTDGPVTITDEKGDHDTATWKLCFASPVARLGETVTVLGNPASSGPLPAGVIGCVPSPSRDAMKWLAPFKSCPASGREPERTASTDTSGSLRLAPEVPAGLERPRGDWPPGSFGEELVKRTAELIESRRARDTNPARVARDAFYAEATLAIAGPTVTTDGGSGFVPPLGANDVAIDARTLAELRSAAKRAHFLSDEAGRLVTENRDLLAENARLRRSLDALERKTPKPRGGSRS